MYNATDIEIYRDVVILNNLEQFFEEKVIRKVVKCFLPRVNPSLKTLKSTIYVHMYVATVTLF